VGRPKLRDRYAMLTIDERIGVRGREVRWHCSCGTVGSWSADLGAGEVARKFAVEGWQEHYIGNRCRNRTVSKG
jgi:hypothetical protein